MWPLHVCSALTLFLSGHLTTLLFKPKLMAVFIGFHRQPDLFKIYPLTRCFATLYSVQILDSLTGFLKRAKVCSWKCLTVMFNLCYIDRFVASAGTSTHRVKLTAGVTCQSCVLQWRYRAGMFIQYT